MTYLSMHVRRVRLLKARKPVEIKSILKRRLNVKEDWILDGHQAVEYGFADIVFGKGQNTSIENILKRL